MNIIYYQKINNENAENKIGIEKKDKLVINII